MERKELGMHALVMAAFFGLITLLFVFTPEIPFTRHLVRAPEAVNFVRIMAGSSALAAGACLLARRLAGRDRPGAAIFTLALGGLLFGQAANAGQDLLSFQRSMAGLARNMSPFVHANTRIYCVEDYPQTLTFYLQRTCTVVHYRGELDFGIEQEPWRWIDSVDSFVAQWRRDGDALAVLERSTYEKLLAAGVPMEHVADSLNKVAVRKP
jgi:hypothetical protein